MASLRNVLEPSASSSGWDADREALFARVQWLMFIRLVLVTGLFILALLLRTPASAEGPSVITAIYPLFIAFYALSGLYAWVAQRVPNLRFFVHAQFAADAASIALLLLLTGGTWSIFSLLFVFPILGAGFLRLERGGFLVAVMVTIAYLASVAAAWSFGVDDLGAAAQGADELAGLRTYSTAGFHVASFFLVAFLSETLSRRQAETGRALAETTSHLQRLQTLHGRIVQNMDTGLLTLDETGRITSFNRAAERITGCEGPQVVGRPLHTVLPGLGDADQLGASAPPGAAGDRVIDRGAQGRLLLRVGASPLRNAAGEFEGLIITFEDRTAVAVLEERLQREERLAAVGRLSAGIAHEIRNPLASITGSVQILRADLRLEPADDELLGIVEREAERLGRLVTDFLAMTRDEAPTLRPARLAPLIGETVRLLQTQGLGRRLRVEAEVGYDPEVAFDEARIRQVLWNLINNAVQVQGGGGRVRVATRRLDPSRLRSARLDDAIVGEVGRFIDAAAARGCALRLSVEDEGPGIPADRVQEVFDPFYTTRAGGTGLGLAIAARIVEAHGGLMSVRTRVGQGSRFSVWLPVERDVEPTDASLEVTDWGLEDPLVERLADLDGIGETLP